jgi:hypothetical protein
VTLGPSFPKNSLRLASKNIFQRSVLLYLTVEVISEYMQSKITKILENLYKFSPIPPRDNCASGHVASPYKLSAFLQPCNNLYSTHPSHSHNVQSTPRTLLETRQSSLTHPSQAPNNSLYIGCPQTSPSAPPESPSSERGAPASAPDSASFRFV